MTSLLILKFATISYMSALIAVVISASWWHKRREYPKSGYAAIALDDRDSWQAFYFDLTIQHKSSWLKLEAILEDALYRESYSSPKEKVAPFFEPHFTMNNWSPSRIAVLCLFCVLILGSASFVALTPNDADGKCRSYHGSDEISTLTVDLADIYVTAWLTPWHMLATSDEQMKSLKTNKQPISYFINILVIFSFFSLGSCILILFFLVRFLIIMYRDKRLYGFFHFSVIAPLLAIIILGQFTLRPGILTDTIESYIPHNMRSHTETSQLKEPYNFLYVPALPGTKRVKLMVGEIPDSEKILIPVYKFIDIRDQVIYCGKSFR